MCCLAELAFVTKKKTIHASEQTRDDIIAERDQFRQEIAKIDPDRLVFVDETGIDTHMTRRYGRAPAGQRAQGSVPQGQRHHLTVLGALSRKGGIVAAMSLAAATSTTVFLAFVQQVLLPTLQRIQPNAVVVMDNLSSHKSSAIANAFEVAKIPLHFLPRYSPDLSPIELGWSKIKSILRSKDARSLDQLDQELGPTLDAVTPGDAAAWFRHCGLSTPN